MLRGPTRIINSYFIAEPIAICGSGVFYNGYRVFTVQSNRTAQCRSSSVNGFGIILSASTVVRRSEKHGFCFSVATKMPKAQKATLLSGLLSPAIQAHPRTLAQIVALTDRCIRNGRANGPMTHTRPCFGFSILSNGFMWLMLGTRHVASAALFPDSN